MEGKFRAHANIAFIKYWGKKDEELHLPYNNSLSFTQAAFYTDTRVRFSNELSEDVFFLNGEKQSPAETAKISKFVDAFRELKNTNLRVEISSFNNMPTAAGFGSSTSAYAALTPALNKALGLGLNDKQLTTYARRGSGSASRSIYGGLVEWHEGHDHDSSYAEQVDPADWGLATISVISTAKRKKHSSRDGMRSAVETSPYYSEWPKLQAEAMVDIKKAITARDIDKIGQIAEHNALSMHALTISSQPPIIYFNNKTMEAIDMVHKLREEGLTAYFTVDAGPNIVIVCPLAEADTIIARFKQSLPEVDLILSEVGPGIKELESWDYE